MPATAPANHVRHDITQLGGKAIEFLRLKIVHRFSMAKG